MPHKIEPLDDYIEPLMPLKASIASLEKELTRGQLLAAMTDIDNAEAQLTKLRNWCWKHQGE